MGAFAPPPPIPDEDKAFVPPPPVPDEQLQERRFEPPPPIPDEPVASAPAPVADLSRNDTIPPDAPTQQVIGQLQQEDVYPVKLQELQTQYDTQYLPAKRMLDQANRFYRIPNDAEAFDVPIPPRLQEARDTFAEQERLLLHKQKEVASLGGGSPAPILDEKGVPFKPTYGPYEHAADLARADEQAKSDAEKKRQENLRIMGREPRWWETFPQAVKGIAQDALVEGMRTFQNSNIWDAEKTQQMAMMAHDTNVIAGLGKGIPHDVARGTADVLALMAGNPAGKAGILTAAFKGAELARARTFDETGDENKANAAALNSIITLPILLATGQAASKFASGLLPEGASALKVGATELAAGATANVGTDLLLHAVEGQPYDWRSFTADALFALHGAWSRFGEAAKAKGDTAGAVTAEQAKAKIGEAISDKGETPPATTQNNAEQNTQTGTPDGGVQPRSELPVMPTQEGGEGVQPSGQGNGNLEQGLARGAPEEAQQVAPPERPGKWTGGDVGQKPQIAFKLEDGTIVTDPNARIHAMAFQDLGLASENRVTPGFIIHDEFVPGSQTNPEAVKKAQERINARFESPPPDSPVSKWTGATDPVRLKPLPGGRAGGTTIFGDIADLAKRGIKLGVSKIKDLAEFTPFRASLLDWSAQHQLITQQAKDSFRDITKAVPDAVARDGITNWIQTGGDATELANRAAATKDLKLKAGYEAALKLTPEQLKVAQDVKGAYDALLKRANSYGINIAELPNYVNQLWQRSPMTGLFRGRALKATTQHQKARFYDNYFAGEQAGLKPATKDIGKLLPMYINDVNRAIADKQLVQRLATAKAEDGRPLLAPRGNLGTVDTDTGKAYFVKPETQNEDIRDYRNLEQPALHAWRWQGKDEAGNPIFVKSDLVVHPDIAQHLKNVLNQPKSTFKDNPVGATLDAVNTVQSYLKQTMLGFFSPFHAVTEAIHAVGHKINPLGNLTKVDLNDPAHMDAAQHGLMLGADRVSQQDFMEGLAGGGKNLIANAIGKVPYLKGIKTANDAIQNWLFETYIPSLKLKTYNAALERNTKRYAADVASGKVSPDQVKHLTAEQVNAAYGHLNYTDMGRNPTLQKFLRLTTLAPDFLEARGRFAGQAIKGVLGSKSGREQLAALGFIGAALYLSARVTNQVVDKDPHWDDPFGIHIGNRRYTVRSVPGDIVELFKDQRKFISGRLSPLVGKGTLESLSGVNYRGEKVGGMEVVKDVLTGSVPLTLQPFVRGLSESTKNNPVSVGEQLLGALGVHVNRISPINDAYKIAQDWKDKQGIPKDRGVYPTSKYQQLRYALEDNDTEKAKAELAKLKAEVKDKGKVVSGFKESLHHPFTDNALNDAKMRKSLSPEDRAKFDAAVKRRQEIWSRFQRLR